MHYLRPVRAIRYAGYLVAAVLLVGAGIVVLTSGGTGGSEPLQSPPPESDALEVGKGYAFSTISEAVEASTRGDTLVVHAGVYRESVRLDQAITIEAAGDGDAWIDGECERDSGIHVYSGEGTVISGIGVRNTISAGVLIGNTGDDAEPPQHITVQGLTIQDFDCQSGDGQFNAGIAVWHSRCCIRLMDNTITYRTEGDVRGRGNGIWFKSTDDQPSGGSHLIARNTIIGGWDGIGGEAEGDIHGSFDSTSVIEGNVISGCWDDGIQSEGGNYEIAIRDNEISGCGTGIAFAPTLQGQLIIERNNIHDLETGLYDNLFCFKTGGEGESSGIVRLTRNTCDTEGDGLLQTNSGLPIIISRNNCFNVTRYVVQLGDAIPEGTSFNKDTFWTSDPDRFIDWDGEKYASLDEFQETGHEADGEQSRSC